MQTVIYFNLVGVEEDIMSKRFKWSYGGTLNDIKYAISLAIVHASAIRTHLSVYGISHPISAASVRPRHELNVSSAALSTSLIFVSKETVTRSVMPTSSGLLRSVNVSSLDDGACAINVVAPIPADDAVDGRDRGGRNLEAGGSHVLATSSVSGADVRGRDPSLAT